MKEFTREELATHNGKDGQRSYIAYQGVVYDLTDSAMWGEGEHEAMHFAGSDLTADHDDAPHDVYVTDFPEIGRLV